MCTVSYLPLQGGGYILTSNRDEAPQRHAVEIRHSAIAGQQLVFPVDPHAGGTWFCVSNAGKAACILNGAYVPFKPDSRYTHSRGTMLLDFMQYPSVDDFVDTYALTTTAPFTLLAVEDGLLNALIWDGSTLEVQALDPGHPAFWSSVTLYPEDVRQWRRALFEKWVSAYPDFDQDEIIRFHRYGGKDDHWNGFVMNRQDRVKTLSITSVKRQTQSLSLKYSDLMTGETHLRNLDVTTLDVAKD